MLNVWFQMTSTCLHHSHLEITADAYKLQSNNEIESRTVQYKSVVCSGSTTNSVVDKITMNNCQKPNDYNKKSVSIPAQYKPTHNKSEIGHKQKSCPLHKKKKIKDETFTPFVSDHLIKTY